MPRADATDFAILDYIQACQDKNGFPPSVREIGAEVGLNSTSTVHYRLKKLEDLGYIRRDNSKNRAVKLIRFSDGTENVQDSRSEFEMIPILGNIAAGKPITAIQEYEETFPLPKTYVRGRELFALRVKGDSMINAGIFNGDYIIVQHQTTADNGDIVVALVHDYEEATVKTFYKEDGHFRLQPENDTMEPIYVKEVAIQGKVVGLFRDI